MNRGADSSRKDFHTVGIALAAFDPAPEIFAEQLKSIQDQTYKDWVCVITFDSPLEPVINHPSIKPFTQDTRFHFLENPERLGHKKNFERAIQECLKLGVDAIGCSDQDDLWYPHKIETSVKALNQAGALSLVHCDMQILNADGTMPRETMWQIEKKTAHNVESAHIIIRNMVAGCAMLFDAELAKRFPVIPEGLDYHDWWYALVASRHGGIHPIRQPLFAYRQHGGNVVGATPFKGTFAVNNKSPIAIARKTMGTFDRSFHIAQAAVRNGLDIGPLNHILFLSYFDWGFGLLFIGLRHWIDDKPLARASFARALGKPLYLLFYKLTGRKGSLWTQLEKERKAGALI